jgi:hypothetical protein
VYGEMKAAALELAAAWNYILRGNCGKNAAGPLRLAALPTSRQGNVLVQGPLVGCAGTVGGVFHGIFWKSKNSVMSEATASRFVKFGKPNRTSISLRIAVLSAGVCDTKFFLLKGETTIRGIRKPVRLKSPGGSGGLVVMKSLGGMPSGLGTCWAVASCG